MLRFHRVLGQGLNLPVPPNPLDWAGLNGVLPYGYFRYIESNKSIFRFLHTL
jgi:hypothetical protein